MAVIRKKWSISEIESLPTFQPSPTETVLLISNLNRSGQGPGQRYNTTVAQIGALQGIPPSKSDS